MLYTSGSLDDIMLSHNGASGPESNTTHMFGRVYQKASPCTVALYNCRIVRYWIPHWLWRRPAVSVYRFSWTQRHVVSRTFRSKKCCSLCAVRFWLWKNYWYA